ncbi:anucleate primary sterigmata protein B [Cordyceps fumosorosea ARSEF 2679]|uniref:Anucleate primary sterigmata protein B n=1 Tax=Cordyceps fumosorosea (strain ARSEF 2679) TaxID=1081104 RepID=A0A167QMY1_CORFA|nr:anucleate primary sterigmata protein B [Cordyceps fumosorosea ARSEF 2679]OAA57786.1 anucleate primary sterigmata protein B [Cordyceps fumosorosea ARSEF 2679]
MADSTDTPGGPLFRPSTATRDANQRNDDAGASSPATVAAPAKDTSTPKGPSRRGPGPDHSLFDAAPIDNTMAPEDNVSEAAVRQHFKDVESSFLPVLSPIPTAPAIGEPATDDTFLFDSPQKIDRAPLPPVHHAQEPDTTAVSTTTSNLEAFDSSPTAAAAARTVSRAVSMASNATRHATDADEDNGAAADESFASSLDHNDSRWSQSQRSDRHDAGSTPGFGLRKQRPKYLRSRFGSQRSSTSSFITNAESFDDGDLTSNQDIDMALQSGGVMPAMGMPRFPSGVMPRPVSIGSIVSGVGMDDFGDTSQQLEPLPEVDSPARANFRFDPLKTPKPSRENLNATPTDTVIAQHVKNVHVPESLAKEYKFRSGLETPFRPTNSNAGAGTVSRTGKSLTLKEQSSTIEKLSKENFDLKLKVMFLSDRLDKLSEEGIKEMISENVELKTNLAILQRDNKVLRKRVKELEKRIQEDEERPSTGGSSNDQANRLNDQEAWEREQELIFLRERVEEYAVEIEKLRTERVSKESEKKKLADIVKSLGERAGEQVDRQEEADVWRDLLEQETAHREQTEDDNVRLRDEVFKLKKEMAAMQSGHTTNIYNIAKRQRDHAFSPNKPADLESSNAGFSAASTLVDELRRESEKLRHENAELRREVGAQTSMLTSRNREKDRLQQEIEDLKISQGRGGAASTADSILERSASRAGARYESPSRASAPTLPTAVEDAEREELENRLAEARDRMNEAKMANQELQRELQTCMADFEMAVTGKQEAENAVVSLQEELDTAMHDLMALQAERNATLEDNSRLEEDFETLRLEAQSEVQSLDTEIERCHREIEILQADLADRAENFDALQNAMREMSQSVVGLEDEQNKKLRRIQQLEAEIESSNRELEAFELKLSEESEKNRRLSVQQESSQGEIAFLREEQEADKIRIGDLEAAIANAEQSLRDEKDRAKELDERLQQERAQREMVANQEKEEVQQFVNELNREASAAKDEARRLRKSLSSREVEATAWKERLQELENNLRVTLGDLNGTRSSLLGSIARIQRDLENTVRELDVAKASVVEKDRLIKQRDALLESLGLESQKANELLEKERLAHRHTKSDYETFQRTHQHLSRTASTQDVRIAELENTRGQERRKLAMLEQSAREQLMERNELLLQLWKRLSVLCGREWAHSHTLVDKQAVPSIEVISSRLPGFTKNLMAAIKMIENMLKSFEGKINSVERDLTREYQALENNLDMRAKRLDRVETLVRNQIASGAMGSMTSQELRGRLSRVEHAYQKLKVEYETLKTATSVRARAAAQHGGDSPRSGSAGGSPSPAVHRGPGERDKERAGSSRGSRESRIPSSVHRGNQAATGSDAGGSLGLEVAKSGDVAAGAGNGSSYKNMPLMLRLKNLEEKLSTERERRSQEREAARQRLGDLEEENKGLRSKIQRRQLAE